MKSAPSRTPRLARVIKAILTNQVARFWPRAYVRLVSETGRGFRPESPDQVAGYFLACFDEYFAALGITLRDREHFLAGKRILEYGPGDVPAMALLMVACGARSVVCVDRFPLIRASPKNVAIIDALLSGLSAEQRRRAEHCYLRPGDITSGLNPEQIHYKTQAKGLSGLRDQIDLVVSRAVLEHVNDLPAILRDMCEAMTSEAVAVHKVDLRSHGLHETNRLDFLTWPDYLWRLMYSHKGVPNRLRVNSYRALLSSQFASLSIAPTLLADLDEVNAVRPSLAAAFRELPDEDLRCLDIWLVFAKKGAATTVLP